MPSAQFLGDPLEGTEPAGQSEWWKIQAETATSETQRQTIEKNRNLLFEFAKSFRPHYYVSCWHMNALESAKMWKYYTHSPAAVAIATTYRVLRECLPHYVEIGMVRYIDYTNERLPSLNMFEYITHKNINFCFEREVRAVTLPPPIKGVGGTHFRENHFESENQKGLLVFAPEVDIGRLINTVLLHPEASREFAESMCSACEAVKLPEPIQSAFAR